MNNKLVKTLIIVCVGLSLLVVLTACAANTSAPAVTVTVPAEPEEVYTPPTDDELFLTAVRATGNDMLMQASDSSIIEAAVSTCDLLDEGYSVLGVMEYLISSDPNMTDTMAEGYGIVIGAGIAVYCPEYTDQLTELGY